MKEDKAEGYQDLIDEATRTLRAACDEARAEARAELLDGLIYLLVKRSAELHGNGQDRESETIEEVLCLLRLELETG